MYDILIQDLTWTVNTLPSDVWAWVARSECQRYEVRNKRLKGSLTRSRGSDICMIYWYQTICLPCLHVTKFASSFVHCSATFRLPNVLDNATITIRQNVPTSWDVLVAFKFPMLTDSWWIKCYLLLLLHTLCGCGRYTLVQSQTHRGHTSSLSQTLWSKTLPLGVMQSTSWTYQSFRWRNFFFKKISCLFCSFSLSRNGQISNTLVTIMIIWD